LRRKIALKGSTLHIHGHTEVQEKKGTDDKEEREKEERKTKCGTKRLKISMDSHSY